MTEGVPPTSTHLSEEEKKKIADALQERNFSGKCPMCGFENFAILDGYFNPPLNLNIGEVILGQTVIPSAVLVCKRCGFICQHALGALDLLPKEGDKK
jgi:hypothetical protein